MTLVCQVRDPVVKLKAYTNWKRLDFFLYGSSKNHQPAYKSCTLSCVKPRFSKVASWNAVKKRCFSSVPVLLMRGRLIRGMSINGHRGHCSDRCAWRRSLQSQRGCVKRSTRTWFRHDHSDKPHHVSSFGKIETTQASGGISCLSLP